MRNPSNSRSLIARALLVVALGTSSPSATAQETGPTAPLDLSPVHRVHVDAVRPGTGSEMEVLFRALTRYQQPVGDLRAVDVELRQDGTSIDREHVLSLESLESSDLGVACVLAVDTSRTMMGEPFQRVKQAVERFVEGLDERDAVALVAYDSGVETVAGFGDARPDAVARLRGLEIDEGALTTALYDGVHRAVELAREASPRHRAFVLVFSDGSDQASSHTLEETVLLANGRGTEPRVPIFTVGYAGRGSRGLEVLRKLGYQTAGESARSTHLESFFADVLRQMRQGYVLRFRTGMDGGTHTVELAVEGDADAREVTYPRIERPPWQRWADVGDDPLLRVLALLAILVPAPIVVRLLRRPEPMHRLVFLSGPLASQRAQLGSGVIHIGALPDNDLVLPTRAVSRRHALIHVRRHAIEIEDLGSTNGIQVNGTSIRFSPLRPGDKIQIGDVEMLLEN